MAPAWPSPELAACGCGFEALKPDSVEATAEPMEELNQPQADAVAHDSGQLLIFAGAGSGKTLTITYRIANLLATHHVAPYRILAVTFTNKAAGEMRARLVKLAGEDIVRDLWVGTFHSICARLLRRYAVDAGLSPKDRKSVV